MEAKQPEIVATEICEAAVTEGLQVTDEAAVLPNECGAALTPRAGTAYAAEVEAGLRSGDIDGVFNVLAEVRSRGAQLDSAVYKSVLCATVQAQRHAHTVEVLRDMCAAGSVPEDATFNNALDGAVRSRSFAEAWDILEILLSHGRKADKYFVSILTKSLESSQDRRWVRRGIGLVDCFVEQQREDVDEIVFNSLLNVLGHVGDMLKLQQTMDKMYNYGVPPSAVTYGTVVKAYGRARDIDAVLRVWQDMRQRRLGVNPVTCGCVLDACVKCGHLDKAMAIFQEMRLQGMHKNTVLYTTLIKGLAKSRDLVGAVHLYQEMRQEHVPCNLVTFNSLMDVCVRVGDLQMAAVFLQDMMQLAIEPDLITFSTLIKGYSHIGEVGKGLALAEELKSRGLKCDEIMYNSLIDGCAKAHDLEKGLAVFGDMLQNNVPPSNITFSILVKLYFENSRQADAFQLVDEMQSVYRCPPSRVVYLVLLRCCAQFGGAALTRGAELLTDLASKRHSKLPDQGMVGTVMAGCVQHGDLDTAIQLAREFGSGRNRQGTAPLDGLRSLCEALTRAGDTARGHELLEFLRKRGLPNAHASQLRNALNGQVSNIDAQHTDTRAAGDVQQYNNYWAGYGQQQYYQQQYGQPTQQDFYNAALYAHMGSMGLGGFPPSPGPLSLPGNVPGSLPSSYSGSYAGSLPGSLPGSYPASPAVQGCFAPPPPPYNPHAGSFPLQAPSQAYVPHSVPPALDITESLLPQVQPIAHTVPPPTQVPPVDKENAVPPSNRVEGKRVLDGKSKQETGAKTKEPQTTGRVIPPRALVHLDAKQIQ